MAPGVMTVLLLSVAGICPCCRAWGGPADAGRTDRDPRRSFV